MVNLKDVKSGNGRDVTMVKYRTCMMKDEKDKPELQSNRKEYTRRSR